MAPDEGRPERLPALPRLHDLQAEKGKRNLRHFIRYGWHVLEPTRAFVPGWHADAIADHLMAVSQGQIRNLIIEVPPGHMKSLSVSVFWPAWVWIDRADAEGKQPAQTMGPSTRWLFASYSGHLSTRDSLKQRHLMASQWYRYSYGKGFKVTNDAQDAITNDKTGFRLATTVGGFGTGERVHYAVNDDLIRVNDAESEAKLIAAVEHMKAMATRGVDPVQFRQVLIMQRVTARDPAGWARSHGEWECLTLPTHFSSKRKCRTSIGFEDPRKVDGELLWPAVFPGDEVKKLEVALGPYSSAAQLEQNPTIREGGLFKPGKIQIVDVLPWDCIFERGWDFAGSTDNTSPYSAGVKLGVDALNRIFIAHCRRERGQPSDIELMVKQLANLDGAECETSIPQDPGQAGKAQVLYYVTQVLFGKQVHFSTETGSKVTRATPLANQVEVGNVFMLKDTPEHRWNESLIEEMRSFPFGDYKDQVDAAARAYNRLVERLPAARAASQFVAGSIPTGGRRA